MFDWDLYVCFVPQIILDSKSVMVRRHLHVLNPFEEFKTYVASLDLETIPWTTLAKLPSLTLCVKAVEYLRLRQVVAEAQVSGGGNGNGAGTGAGKKIQKDPTWKEVLAFLEDVFRRRQSEFNDKNHQEWEVEAAKAKGDGKAEIKAFVPEDTPNNLKEVREKAMR